MRSVISQEGAASILWRDPVRAQDAATAMKITASDLVKLKIIDAVIPEPLGGAHRDPQAAFSAASDAISEAFDVLSGLSGEALKTARRDKFLAIGRNLA